MNVKPLEFSGGPECRFDIPDGGETTLELTIAGISRLRLGRVECGKFSESTALPGKLRLHSTHDGLVKTLESRSVIPFGCEYQLERSGEIISGLARLTTDVRALNGGRIGDLTLEEIYCPAPWKQLEFLVNAETSFRSAAGAGGELYRGAEPLLMLRVHFPDGAAVEFAVGNDLWRQRAGLNTPGAHSEFTLTADAGGVSYRRRVLIRDPETEPEKRPWRFSAILGWRTPADVNASVAAVQFRLPWCMLGSASRRELRKRLRASAGSQSLTGIAPRVCFDAAHLERPSRGELEHFDLEEHIAAYIWGNRRLFSSGGAFTMLPEAGGLFADSVIVGNLGIPPLPLETNQGTTIS